MDRASSVADTSVDADDSSTITRATTTSSTVALPDNDDEDRAVNRSTDTYSTIGSINSSDAHGGSPDLAQQVRQLNTLLSSPGAVLGSLADTSRLTATDHDDDDDDLAEELADLRHSEALLAAQMKGLTPRPRVNVDVTGDHVDDNDTHQQQQQQQSIMSPLVPRSILSSSRSAAIDEATAATTNRQEIALPQQPLDAASQFSAYDDDDNSNLLDLEQEGEEEDDLEPLAEPRDYYDYYDDAGDDDDDNDDSGDEQQSSTVATDDEELDAPELSWIRQSTTRQPLTISTTRPTEPTKPQHLVADVAVTADDFDTPSPDSHVDWLENLEEGDKDDQSSQSSNADNSSSLESVESSGSSTGEEDNDLDENDTFPSDLMKLPPPSRRQDGSTTPSASSPPRPERRSYAGPRDNATILKDAAMGGFGEAAEHDTVSAIRAGSRRNELNQAAQTIETDARSTQSAPVATVLAKDTDEDARSAATEPSGSNNMPTKSMGWRPGSMRRRQQRQPPIQSAAVKPWHPITPLKRRVGKSASTSAGVEEDVLGDDKGPVKQAKTATEEAVIVQKEPATMSEPGSENTISSQHIHRKETDQLQSLALPRRSSKPDPDSPGSLKPDPPATMVRTPSHDYIARTASQDTASSNTEYFDAASAESFGSESQMSIVINELQLSSDAIEDNATAVEHPSQIELSESSKIAGVSIGSGSFGYSNNSHSFPRLCQLDADTSTSPRKPDRQSTEQPQQVQTTGSILKGSNQHALGLAAVAPIASRDATMLDRRSELANIGTPVRSSHPNLGISIPDTSMLPRPRSYNDLEESRQFLASMSPLGITGVLAPPPLLRNSQSDESQPAESVILDSAHPPLPDSSSNPISPATTTASNDFEAMWDTLSLHEPPSVDTKDAPPTATALSSPDWSGFGLGIVPPGSESNAFKKEATPYFASKNFAAGRDGDADEDNDEEAQSTLTDKSADQPTGKRRSIIILAMILFIVAAAIWIPVLIWQQNRTNNLDVSLSPTVAPSSATLAPTVVSIPPNRPPSASSPSMPSETDTLFPSITLQPSLAISSPSQSIKPSASSLPVQLTSFPTALVTGSPSDPEISTPTATPSVMPTPNSPTVTIGGLLGLLSSRSPDGGVALRDTASPQYQAYTWLSGNKDVIKYSDDRLLQRYSLAVLYLSTDGPNWAQSTMWLSDDNECSWFVRSTTPCGPAGDFRRLEIYYNNLSGSLPLEISLLSNLNKINLSGGPTRSLSGSIPPSLGRMTELTELLLQNNDLTGTIPSELGKLTTLSALELSHNKLTGTLMTHLGKMTRLEQLRLSSNGISGSIPAEIRHMKYLSLLALDNNMLSGLIGPDIGQLTRLRTLILDNNQLTSTLPGSIGNLKDLMVLSLSGNSLSGSLPYMIGQLTSLMRLSLADNSLTGRLPNSLSNLKRLTEELDLSFNAFTGTIPTGLGQIDGSLRVMKLDNNALTGTIPHSFVKFTRLNLLNLQSNSLTGSMPTGVCNLFNKTLPSIFVDCKEVDCPCCNYCCTDGQLDCQCRYQGTPKEWMCYF